MSDLIGRKVTVEVPASSANLGPGFDCLALALDMWLRVTVEAVDGEDSWQGVGEAEGLSFGGDNRCLHGLMAGFSEMESRPRPALRVQMDSSIPMGRGLGSSAAATVAGLVAGQTLTDARLDRLLNRAALIEGHPDNASAAILGGFVIVTQERVTRFDVPPSLRIVVFVPERQLATADMRAVLPEHVRLTDAALNAAAVGGIVAAFASGSLAGLSAVSDDRLHEPYRAAEYPELPKLKRAAIEAGAIGAALSGAGSSVIALCTTETVAAVHAAFDEASQQLLPGSVSQLAPSREGTLVDGRALDRDVITRGYAESGGLVELRYRPDEDEIRRRVLEE